MPQPSTVNPDPVSAAYDRGLWRHATAYNLANFLRGLMKPSSIDWSEYSLSNQRREN
jgi:hypothetical protein